MRIFQRQLEPGAIYTDDDGQSREIVSMDGPKVVYRMLTHGQSTPFKSSKLPPVGGVEEITKHCFARWAKQEVA